MTKLKVNWNDPNLVKYLEEITRDEGGSTKSTYQFVDVGYLDTLIAKHNHLLLGRRGSGKSVLFRQLQIKCKENQIKDILIDIESVEQKSNPNLIIKVLIKIFDDLKKNSNYGVFQLKKRYLLTEFSSTKRSLSRLLREPDVSKVIKKSEEQQGATGDFDGKKDIRGILDLSFKISKKRNNSTVREWEGYVEKMQELYDSIGKYRKLITKWLQYSSYEAIFLMLDDFYQIRIDSQPIVADYFKRLFKGIPVFLKIATVPGRTLLFIQDEMKEAGMQRGHDITVTNLDFSLEYFDNANNFIGKLFNNIFVNKLKMPPASELIDFQGSRGMVAFTEASGGNARDFINILKEVVGIKRDTQDPIYYSDIKTASINYSKLRKNEMIMSNSNFKVLNFLLTEIINLCSENEDIGFFVAKLDLKKYPAINALLTQLIDNRFLHILSNSYSPKSSKIGLSVSYILSIGIYSEVLEGYSYADRKLNSKEYPRLQLTKFANMFPDLSPALEFIGKDIKN